VDKTGGRARERARRRTERIPTIKTTRFLPAAAAALLTLTLIPIRARADPPQYRVTVLEGIGGDSSYGVAINASGQVAGSATIKDVNQGDTSRRTHAVRWTGTTPTDLGTLDPSGGPSHGTAINAAGQVAGSSFSRVDDHNTHHAVRWTGSTAKDLGLVGGRESPATAINDAGQVAGFFSTGSGSILAVRWTGTTPEKLGTLGGKQAHGFAINASGQVAGGSIIDDDTKDYPHRHSHAVRWIGTKPTDLGTLGGSSRGFGINAAGDVTGMSQTPDSAEVAFLYTGGNMYDLTTLLVPGSGVTHLRISDKGNSINDRGQIAATGFIDGKPHAVRLDPVAKP
jgi:probable HAF family extracellular repeat protein